MNMAMRNLETANLQTSTGTVRASLGGLLLACLLAGCSILGGSKSPSTIYAPDPRVQADPAWPSVN